MPSQHEEEEVRADESDFDFIEEWRDLKQEEEVQRVEQKEFPSVLAIRWPLLPGDILEKRRQRNDREQVIQRDFCEQTHPIWISRDNAEPQPNAYHEKWSDGVRRKSLRHFRRNLQHFLSEFPPRVSD